MEFLKLKIITKLCITDGGHTCACKYPQYLRINVYTSK